MGNCFALHKLKSKCCSQSAMVRRENFSGPVKTDGKILECTKPVLVEDLLMNFSCYGNKDHHFPVPSSVRPINPASEPIATGTKRIKLIITKHQLQEMLSRDISEDEMCLLDIQNIACCGLNSFSRWQPVLETIPEESE